MNSLYEDTLIEIFGKVQIKDLHVLNERRHIFVCGGPVDVNASTPLSLRHRYHTYTITHNSEVHDSTLFAEEFKDYFKDEIFPNLTVFENEIASIASLIIIFLESAGSLVELGMFCTRPNLFDKLLIIAPSDKVQGEDSFIFLGPLEHIMRKDNSSVAIFPWPNGEEEYSNDNLKLLDCIVNDNLKKLAKRPKFRVDEFGHKAILIAEIIRICFPILKGELELCLEALNIKMDGVELARHIYLLSKLELINKYRYSNYKYYYPIDFKSEQIDFGNKINFEGSKVSIQLRQLYFDQKDEQSKKRWNALRNIMKTIKGASNENN